jgi:hypothetical protein
VTLNPRQMIDTVPDLFLVVFVLLQFQYKGTSSPTALPAGVQLTLVSATMPTSLPDILGSVVEVH